MRNIFSKEYTKILKKTQTDPERFSKLAVASSLIVALLISGIVLALLIFRGLPPYYAVIVFLAAFFLAFEMIKLIPAMSLRSRKAMLESDLLYSARHLLLKLESGSSLVNSLESVSTLNTKSSAYFKKLMLDISLGTPIEDAIEKAIAYSPSLVYSKILSEIKTSLETGSDMRKTIKNIVEDVTRNHLIHIQEYGKKLNPMSMFYMILGTVFPSIGTALIIVAASLLPGVLVINFTVLMFLLFMLLVVQLFFLFSFRSLKPGVME